MYYPGIKSIYAPPKEDLILHITTSVLKMKTYYANPMFLIMGDFNDLPVEEICNTCKFKQIVKKPTRKKATLDLILTNAKNYLYETPMVLPKIGVGDHNSILVKPKKL